MTRIGPALLLLVGCSDQDLVKTDDTAAGDDTGGDSADHSTTCPPYAGLDAAGTRWTYEFTGTDSHAIRQDHLTEAGVAPVLSRDQAGSGEGWSTTSELELHYRCDAEGAWLVGQTYHSVNVTSHGKFEDRGSVVWSPGWLFVPWSMDSATTWDVAFTVTTESEQYGTVEASWSGRYMVENTETVETGVGSVEALEVVGGGSAGENATWMDTSYRHPEMGVVGEEGSFALTEYTPG